MRIEFFSERKALDAGKRDYYQNDNFKASVVQNLIKPYMIRSENSIN